MAREIGKQVGKAIKDLREAHGLTQAQLAGLLGKSVETISNFERGKVVTSLLTLEQLAGCLGVAVRDFFTDSPAAAPVKPYSDFAAKVRNAADYLSEDDLEIVAGLVDVLAARGRRRHGK
ncbi:MAG: helix-turn-helix transcriptional regulator [Magnetospirillum sp.]|nr:helix-turn-helix transcriptional regulator [Magnetospirillum sp.]